METLNLMNLEEQIIFVKKELEFYDNEDDMDKFSTYTAIYESLLRLKYIGR